MQSEEHSTAELSTLSLRFLLRCLRWNFATDRHSFPYVKIIFFCHFFPSSSDKNRPKTFVGQNKKIFSGAPGIEPWAFRSWADCSTQSSTGTDYECWLITLLYIRSGKNKSLAHTAEWTFDSELSTGVQLHFAEGAERTFDRAGEGAERTCVLHQICWQKFFRFHFFRIIWHFFIHFLNFSRLIGIFLFILFIFFWHFFKLFFLSFSARKIDFLARFFVGPALQARYRPCIPPRDRDANV